jgi:uncharacterized membrane protein
MLTVSIFLALGLIEVDSRVTYEWQKAFPRIFGLGADGSRGMLTAIAGSMLTVAALAFSLTLAAVTQASGQFTPRIYRNFLRDRANQFVLGYFVSFFAYCLIILRTIRGGDELKFVPSISVAVGLVFALGGVIVLIFFIHHIAVSLQITTIINNIVAETKESIETMFPQTIGKTAATEEQLVMMQAEDKRAWTTVKSLSSGYVQTISSDSMLDFAEEHNVVLRMERSIGQFVGTGATLVSVAADMEDSESVFELDDDAVEDLNACFGIHRHRTVEQDVGFGIRQIVDIALKALSPGVNDTTTAITCIDFLGEITGELAKRTFPFKIRSRDNTARVIASEPDFNDFVETAFDQIRINGKANHAIFERLIESLVFVAGCTNDETRLQTIRNQLDLIEEYADQTLETEYQKGKVTDRLKEKRKQLNG